MAENDDGATGVVYVYNTTSVNIKLALNGNQLPTLPHAAGKDGSYAAASMTVPRSAATSIDDPVFAQTNTLTVKLPGMSNNYPSVSIDPIGFATNKDLLLYIFYGYMVLVDASSSTIIFNQSPS
jgi:hypothetical protein